VQRLVVACIDAIDADEFIRRRSVVFSDPTKIVGTKRVGGFVIPDLIRNPGAGEIYQKSKIKNQNDKSKCKISERS
jgi:hypothetical protein